ncbi:hypothetical protein E2C01_088889 [Portunus trituberculatus]|uniref:Uncharacterized protein n=1 Tax=Portunus trituberculatus TaxID=210409 RepID=A0A5B7JFV0_PORTR|nr:hypothetical protein [Portunus trituberculatus]
MGKQPRRSCCAEEREARGVGGKEQKAREREKTWLPDKVLEVADWWRRTRQENFNISSEIEPRQTGEDTLHNIRQAYCCGRGLVLRLRPLHAAGIDKVAGKLLTRKLSQGGETAKWVRSSQTGLTSRNDRYSFQWQSSRESSNTSLA